MKAVLLAVLFISCITGCRGTLSCKEPLPPTMCINGYLYYNWEERKRGQLVPVLNEQDQMVECRSAEDDE